MPERISFDTRVRLALYRDFIDTARAPSASRLAAMLAVPEQDRQGDRLAA